MKIKNEAPRVDTRGIFSPLLSREQNPSEAENSSHSSTGLRPRFSAKGDKNQSGLFFRRFFCGHLIVDKNQGKGDSKKPSTNVSSINPFVELIDSNHGVPSNTIAKYRNIIVPANLSVKSRNGAGTKIAIKNAAATFVAKAEYTFNACAEERKLFTHFKLT